MVRTTERIATILRTLASIAAALVASAAVSTALTALPESAGAFATVGPAPVAGSPGLPDGRVYEQVSPANKNGNSAGTPANGGVPTMVAEAGGEGIAYSMTGAIGEAKSGFQLMTVAKREVAGWTSRGAQPRGLSPNALLLQPNQIGFSADLTKVMFWSKDEYLPEAPSLAALLYDIPTGSLTWLDPPPASSENDAEARVAGFSSDMSTFYFRTATGFYEWHDGVESVAGVLPDGSVEPGVLPAGLPSVGSGSVPKSQLRNQVSEDGTRAFFVSSNGAPELYVRETAADGTQGTVLVSRDELLEPVAGQPAPAPHGVLRITFPVENNEGEELSSEVSGCGCITSFGDMYASPDGSRVFFASDDQLTSTAPTGGGMYEFNTLTDSLTYLPGVGASPVLASEHDGSRFLFNGSTGVSLWSEAGSIGGTVTPLEPFPVGGEVSVTPDGSAFVFESAAPFAGFNNGGTHLQLSNGHGPFRNQEIYRYDVAEGSLDCVSCPPAGVTPSGNAYMSHDTSGTNINGGLFFQSRGVSTDGSRVFFDSPDPLVGQDANTRPLEPSLTGNDPAYDEHGRDVYEWENGRIFLISTGTSSQDSFVGDESASGNDVFFSTAQGLSPGDTDEGYDVYDARIPRPGDRPLPPLAPCQGDVCQGPPSVPALLGAPASATFNGLGNPEPATPPVTPKKTTSRAIKCATGKKLSHGKCVKVKSKRKKAKKASHNGRAKS